MSSSLTTGLTTWRCASNQSYPDLKCRAKCYTKQIGNYQKVKPIGEHTHPKKIAPRLPVKKSQQFQQNGKKKIKSKSKSRPKKKTVNPETKGFAKPHPKIIAEVQK